MSVKTNFFQRNKLVSLIVLMAVFSFLFSQPFVWMSKNMYIDLSSLPVFKDYFPTLGLVNLLISVIMFGMGMTLKAEDFKIIVTRPADLLIGIVSQYVYMAGFGWLVATLLSAMDVGDPMIRAQVAVGLVLLGSVPGGTASNVMTFIAKGDVPLSITITLCTTLLAPVLTPTLTLLLAGQWIDVNFWSMFMSIIMVVLLPIVLGIFVHKIVGEKIEKNKKHLVTLSTFCIIWVMGLCIGPNKTQFTSNGLAIVLLTVVAVGVHHILGLIAGYYTGKLFGFSEAKKRALSLEVGLQNSGLSVSLARTAFPDTMALLPCVIATVVHQVISPIVANYFSSKPLEKEENSFISRELQMENI